MPTLFVINGKIRIVIFPRDHNPPHVHVIGPEREAKFSITEISLIENKGFSTRELKLITSYLTERHELLLEKWENIHGEE